jgi:hypothetical protein
MLSPDPAAPRADLTPFPECPAAVWRREIAACETLPDALRTCYRLLRVLEQNAALVPGETAGPIHHAFRSLGE